MKALVKGEPLDKFREVPRKVREIFRTSREIEAKWHIRMQAAFQKYTDNAVSKTINFPNSATKNDIYEAFIMAYRLGCKGLTVYRDGSRESQVLVSGGKKAVEEKGERALIRPRKRPRVAKGVTERVNTGDGMLYVTINEDNEGLCEVFASIGKHGGNVAALSEAIGRLISLSLRCGIDASSVVKQLKGIAGPNPVWEDGQLILSTPDAIAKVLERHIARLSAAEKSASASKTARETDEGADMLKLTYLDLCPDCGGVLVKEEGCINCRSCGFSRCS
jgi:ribonucleoside-diphosphate reductase alpha chain